jgi:hypothetical protein
MSEDDDRRKAIVLLREVGEVVLWRLGQKKLSEKMVYGLETRFVTVIANFQVGPYPEPPIIRVQYPLWNLLTDEERFETVAHEHAHAVDFLLNKKVDHGEGWKKIMGSLGYRDPRSTCRLNPGAQAHIAEKKAKRKMATTDKRATLWVKDGYIFCKTPYHVGFIAELKNDIPSHARSFLPADKVWRVAAAYHQDLMEVVTKYFGEPTIVEQEVHVVAVGGGGNDPFSAMLRVAPDDVLKKVYRMIAAEIHPDKGGDPQAMVTLNAAWAAIKTDRKI